MWLSGAPSWPTKSSSINYCENQINICRYQNLCPKHVFRIKLSSLATTFIQSAVLRPTSLQPWPCWNSPKSWTSRILLLSSPKVLPPYYYCVQTNSSIYVKYLIHSLTWYLMARLWGSSYQTWKSWLPSLRKSSIIWEQNMLLPLSKTCIQTLGLTTLHPTFALSQPELTTAQPDLNQQ